MESPAFTRLAVLLALVLLLAACGPEEQARTTDVDVTDWPEHVTVPELRVLCDQSAPCEGTLGSQPYPEMIVGTYAVDLREMDRAFDAFKQRAEGVHDQKGETRYGPTVDEGYAILRGKDAKAWLVLARDGTYHFSDSFGWSVGGCRGEWSLDGHEVRIESLVRPYEGDGTRLVPIRLCYEESRIRLTTLGRGPWRDPCYHFWPLRCVLSRK